MNPSQHNVTAPAQPFHARLSRLLWRPGVGLGMALAVYLLLTGYQLGLPGLHYDEAKEAGVNAVELLTGAPVTPFRDVALKVAGRRLPVMVQDYIGSLNVYLALPVLAVTGIGAPNLRAVAVLAGLVALVLVAKVVTTWEQADAPEAERVGLTWGGVIAAWLLAASPSFVFWSRQGIFVTNLTQPLCLLAVWQGSRWLQSGAPRSLLWMVFAAGLALYAKLLAVWIIGPWLLICAVRWTVRRFQGAAPAVGLGTLSSAAGLFALSLWPLVWFNLQSGGTAAALLENAGESYYGVDNRAILANAWTRGQQVAQVLRGDHFWYLGGVFANSLAPYAAALLLAVGVWTGRRRMAWPLALLLLAWAASLFTISDLFITHYALFHPFLAAVTALAAVCWAPGLSRGRYGWRSWVAGALVVLWVVLDARAALHYHRALQQSGGLADHSDASYDLAYYLRYNGLGAPLALDWGMDAPVRYLSAGTVRPIEIFGYASPAAPTAEFAARLAPFLSNPDNVYLLHAPESTVFAGRREVFLAEAAGQGLEPKLVKTFAQRDQTPLFELWRVTPP